MIRPVDVIDRLCEAQNAHDVDAMAACFHPDYRSDQPCHPRRAFVGVEQVRKNWSGIFAAVPDLAVEVTGLVADPGGEDVWTEWRWTGTRADGSPMEMAGVTIFGVREGRIASGRLYMEEVERDGDTIDEAVASTTGRSADAD
jgi:ketosteroid isomerase-like protein